MCLRVGMCTCLSAFVYVSCVLKQLDLMHVVSFTTWSLCRKPSKRYNLNVIFFFSFFLFLNKSKTTMVGSCPSNGLCVFVGSVLPFFGNIIYPFSDTTSRRYQCWIDRNRGGIFRTKIGRNWFSLFCPRFIARPHNRRIYASER